MNHFCWSTNFYRISSPCTDNRWLPARLSRWSPGWFKLIMSDHPYSVFQAQFSFRANFEKKLYPHLGGKTCLSKCLIQLFKQRNIEHWNISPHLHELRPREAMARPRHWALQVVKQNIIQQETKTKLKNNQTTKWTNTIQTSRQQPPDAIDQVSKNLNFGPF